MAEYRIFELGTAGDPIAARFHPTAYDRAMAAFRVTVSCQVALRGGNYRYESSEIWIGSQRIDGFERELEQLLQGKVDAAKLVDLGGTFTVSLAAEGDRFRFSLRTVAPLFKGSEVAWESSTPVLREELQKFLVELRLFKTPLPAASNSPSSITSSSPNLPGSPATPAQGPFVEKPSSSNRAVTS